VLNRRQFISSMSAAALAASGEKVLAGQESQELSSAPQRPQPEGSSLLTIDAHRVVGPFPHYWETMVGSGRAVLALRADYQEDLKMVHQKVGIDSVRFHGIFDDEVGVCRVTPRGDVIYNFQYVDQIYDSLLEVGVRPFVELSFMPQVLASGNKTIFWYKANVTPPKDIQAWSEMVTAFARHLFLRYGGSELSRWLFEVWNEPNIDFWAGTQEQYFDFYRHTATTLKAVDKRLRVGGPATAEAAWAPDFIEYCSKNNVPLDFFSTHIYANDPQNKVFGHDAHYALEDVIPLALQKVKNQVRSSDMPHLPIYITEWNSTFMNDPALTDTSFNAAFIAHTLHRCSGLVDAMSYWCFSDVFEEQGVAQNIFYGGYGMIAMRRIPKPSFHAFTLLHRLGHERLASSEGPLIATRRADDSVAVMVWNLTRRDQRGKPKPGQPLSLRLVVQNLGHRNRLSVTSVDDDHGSAFAAYQSMGSPQYPSMKQIRELQQAAELPPPDKSLVAGGRSTEVSVTLAPGGVTLLEFES